MTAGLQRISVRMVLWLALWSCFLESASALDPKKAITQYQQDVWTERDGLPQGSIQAITQTHDGYLWIGTRDGLARFDGLTFKVFRAETHEGLGSNDIRALCEDRSGQLWIGTFNGGLSRYAKGMFTSYTLKDGFPSKGVLQILEDRLGILWCATSDGLAHLRDGKFVVIGASEGLGGRNVVSLCEDMEGQLWAATGGGLLRFAGERFFPFTERAGLPSSSFERIYSDRNGVLWIAATGGDLWCLRQGKFTRFTAQHGLPNNEIRTTLQDREGNLWVGTWSGLCRLQNERFSVYKRQDGLPHDHVEVLFEDREGSLWVGTRGDGLVRLRDGKFSNYTTREGLAHDFAKCVLEDREGALWVGSHGGGLSRFQNGRFTNYTTKDGLASPFVWTVGEDRQGNIWVGTGRPASLSRFNDGKFTSYGSAEGLPVEGGVRALFADTEGNLWIGGDGGGLGRFRAGVFTCFSIREGLPSTSIRAIGQDGKRNLWIGTTEGLCRYRDGQFATFTTDDGLAHNVVYAVYEDGEGVLWFGTQGGLSRYADGRFHSYTSRDGLFQNVIYQVLEDNDQNLWMSSNRGIFRISKHVLTDFDRGRIRTISGISYGIADGMKSTQCEGATQPAGWKSRDGKLWFPTANGVAVINPASIRGNSRPPPVLIEQVVVNNRNVVVEEAAEFSPASGEIRFHYTALSFLAPDKIRFRYKLNGFDKEWVDAETRRAASYKDLRPGHYQFHVAACNSDGVWNETGASFAFYVPPHFYQTVWFYLICAALIALAAWSFHRHRIHQAEAQFSLVLAERNRIARDLHDTLAQGFAGIAFQLEAVATKFSEAPAQAQKHLNLALHMVRHSLAEARRSVMNLRSATMQNIDLSNALAETARQMMADKSVEFDVKTVGLARPLPAKIEDNLLRVGQEAITNALKHSQATKIQIEIEYQTRNVCIKVHDNGRGFDMALPTTLYGAHFGLLGMRERAKQMNGTLRIQSSPGSGTEVTLEIPTT